MIFKGIEFIGRFDVINENKIQFAWSGSTIKADFYGCSVKAKLSSLYYKDYIVVIVDNKVIHENLHIDHDGEYLLVDQLELNKHTIELVKRTEFTIGTVDFKGFDFGEGHLIERMATPFNLKIEIIGDSLTCGFGNEGNEKMEYDTKYDNAYLAYGLITGRIMNADCRLVSCSGYGLIRNYSGDMVNTMPTMIDKITPLSKENWDHKQYIPDIVAINLGTNDFSNGYIPNKNQFVSAYKNLVNTVLNEYPNVKILCTIGPVLTGNTLSITRDYVKDVVLHYSHSVYYLEYEEQLASDGLGVAYHPSLKTHQKMANSLVNKIKEII
ncbi:MAG: hypothetical protein K0Q49_1680 [Haloplasmataceae bacterium]|nr:hypothetical protein [Haloplasmataceae bacterium]